ncbi:thioesterase II family protein [Streptomyces purpureus]|uniref:thioesterase II family protein n=1 Tax=Streptomyces purpureus TaxID=1951 RepID=UPI000361F73D|nr:alpha/beta fold hydrolase [Streptomyces purpureus]
MNAKAHGNTVNGRANAGTWIRQFHPAPDAKLRLVCFPHAGGAAGTYQPLSAALPAGLAALAVQYPGRQDRLGEPCLETIAALADEAAAALDPYTAEPYALFGHSMGALVAFETARRLQSKGLPPAALFVSGRQGPAQPQLPDGLPPLTELDDTWVVAEVRRLGGAGSVLLDHPEIRELALPSLRADFRAVYTYVHSPTPRLTCPVIALTGDRDPRVTVPGARAWEAETTGPFSLHVLEGGHFYLDAHIPRIAELITASLPM